MLNAIKKFFEQNMSSDVPSVDPEHQVKLATAALLVEMMDMDGDVLETEKKVTQEALKTNFNLSDAETNELCRLAEEEVHNATDYYQFTKLIAKYFSQEQKIQVIELLWRVAYADNNLDAYEEHMVRRIADLIYVPHSDYIQTKLNAQKMNVN